MCTRRVAVLIESSRAYGRALLDGVARFSHERGNWSMYFEPRGLDAPPPAWLRSWRGDGVLARAYTPEMRDLLLRLGMPVLDLYGRSQDERLPVITGDNAAIARLVFEHLRERGLRHFAFCGRPHGENPYLDDRGTAFQKLVAMAGFSCHVLLKQRLDPALREWDEEQSLIAGWLERLPKPVGVMACHDDCGYQVLDACRRAGLAVPDAVAVVGVDNDPVLCHMADPPMSSVDPDGARVGYVAAEWLDRMMRGEPPPTQTMYVEPRGLAARRSSDVLAVEDADVAAAVRFVRDRACGGIRVEDVLEAVPVSRSVLERKVRRRLGRTLKTEILRVQVDRARELLVTTDASLDEVARRTGFSSAKYFSDAFRRLTGERPGAYRRARRPG
jgi:LacI family transcriptional regulator